MNNQDENAWVREFEKVEREQNQREGWDGKERLDVIRATYTMPFNHYELKDDNNEIND